MDVRRNDPCPCGSGKKYKRCHGKPTPVSESAEDARWRRLRAALDGFPTDMLRFARKVYGPTVVDEAWDEFTLWESEDGEFDPSTVHMQVFMPWFFHRWAPDPEETEVADAALHGRVPTSVFLERRGRRVDPLLRSYLEACLEAPFTFHEILHARPGQGFRTRDIFTGEEFEVWERSGSRTMEPGDIFFGQLVTARGVTMMEACSAHALPPRDKLDLIDLREEIAAGAVALTPATIGDWDIELREAYLDLIERIRSPRRPHLQNTDGESLAFHRLSFQVPSPHDAFQALKHLSYDTPEEDLLESAELDRDGRVRRVAFAWKVAGNAMHAGWENTVMGHLDIEDDRLVVSVNSAERAARIADLVTAACPAARHATTEIETVEEAMAARPDLGTREDDEEARALAARPEVRDRLRAMTAKHYEGWIHQPLPALDGLAPVEAVRERGGREKVEALIRQIERGGARLNPPLDRAVIRTMRDQLGLAD